MTLSMSNEVCNTYRSVYGVDRLLESCFTMDDYNGDTLAEAQADLFLHGWRRRPQYDTTCSLYFQKRVGGVLHGCTLMV